MKEKEDIVKIGQWYIYSCIDCAKVMKVDANKYAEMSYRCPKCRKKIIIYQGYLSGELNSPVKWCLN